MARKPQPANEATAATLETPTPAAPEPNGDQPAPQPPPARKRRPRDPSAPRPIYLILAINRDTDTIRILADESTIGRARKLAPRVRQSVRDNESGPLIARCKLVS